MSVYHRPIEDRPSQVLLARIISSTSSLDTWLIKYRRSLCHLLGVVVVAILLVYGFNHNQTPWILKVINVLVGFCTLFSLRCLYMMYRYGKKKHVALVFFCVLVLALGVQGVWEGVLTQSLVFLYFIGLGCYLLLQSPYFKEGLENFQSAPALFVLMSFAGLVGFGTLFLYLPDAQALGISITLSEAFFTAISAACVTGLSVIDINTELSEYGQFVVLVLMQVGGLGIMVLSTFAIIAFGGRMGVRTERAFSDFLSPQGVKSTNQLIVFIVISTVAIELLGATLLSYGYVKSGMGVFEGIKLGVFQAVSAFCNAGFSLMSDSLVHLQSSPWMLACYGVLITLGGLGFVAMFEMIRRVILGGRRAPLSVQTKIVLTVTGVLVMGGGVLFSVLEWQGALAHLSYFDRIVNSFFQSVTLRTAGFQSIEAVSFGYPSIVIMLFFMFVGGAPGGTAGGVKVTTFATLIATLPTLVRNDNRVRLFSRTFSMNAVAKGSALIILSISTIGLLWFLLLLTQEGLDPMVLLFEVFSATGTVGLSLGITESLGEFGRLVIALGMFIGRIGPLTLAIALANEERSRVEYPSAEIMIG